MKPLLFTLELGLFNHQVRLPDLPPASAQRNKKLGLLLAIPLHDHHNGKLIGYAGKVLDDSTITKDNPRYLFPPERKRDGNTLVFRKSLFLYNGFRIRGPVGSLVVVEDFSSVWWLTQLGFLNCVALMDHSCSDEQADLVARLVSPAGDVWLVT